jgi:ABC-type polysaccharide/polyol phosphate transport system ATPase subunit
MSEKVISVDNLSKRYLVGHQSTQRKRYTLRDAITWEARNFARKTADFLRGRQIVQGDEVEEFWALKDVSFEVGHGEVLGIIGRNGAGKSTLLKILSRITEPSHGQIRIKGRVASLLEVGTGFHPELTGRENIFLNGAILGMTQREIRNKFDAIVAFAEVEKFLDTAVKYYSSGMYVRLAFAVAAHLEPEILIVDEVLAVGDSDFQKKCLGKMDEVSRSEGRTVLFVSHNMGVITSLCPSVIWLDRGSIRGHGRARAIVDEYLGQGMPSHDRLVRLDHIPRSNTYDSRLRLESLEWFCDLPLKHGQPVKALIRFRTRAPLTEVVLGIGFSDLEGRRLLTYSTDFQQGFRSSFRESGSHSVEIEVESLPLVPALYSLDIGCRSGNAYPLDYLPDIVQLEVFAGPKTPGCIIGDVAGVCLTSKWV